MVSPIKNPTNPTNQSIINIGQEVVDKLNQPGGFFTTAITRNGADSASKLKQVMLATRELSTDNDSLKAKIKEKDAKIEEKDAKIEEKDAQIKAQNSELAKKDHNVKELESIVSQIENTYEHLDELNPKTNITELLRHQYTAGEQRECTNNEETNNEPTRNKRVTNCLTGTELLAASGFVLGGVGSGVSVAVALSQKSESSLEEPLLQPPLELAAIDQLLEEVENDLALIPESGFEDFPPESLELFLDQLSDIEITLNKEIEKTSEFKDDVNFEYANDKLEAMRIEVSARISEIEKHI